MRSPAVSLALCIVAALAACNAERVPAEEAAAIPPATADIVTAPAADGSVAQRGAEVAGEGIAPVEPATVPARFQGRYASDAAACDAVGHESQLSIEADRIEFHESRGVIKSASHAGRVLSLVALLGGEGQSREAAYRFELSDDGTMLSDLSSGLRFARKRCR